MYYGNSSYYHDYLAHHGVKGMKWGVRRARKKAAKEQYRKAKSDARMKRYKAEKQADAAYEKAMSKQKTGLKKVDEEYAVKQKTIDAHYKNELRQPQRDADYAKRRMDYHKNNLDNARTDSERKYSERYYNQFSKSYDYHSKTLSDVQSRYDAATAANKVARDQAAIKIRDLNYDTSQKASATRDSAYAKAGAEYVSSLSLARTTYKEAKRNIKNGK